MVYIVIDMEVSSPAPNIRDLAGDGSDDGIFYKFLQDFTAVPIRADGRPVFNGMKDCLRFTKISSNLSSVGHFAGFTPGSKIIDAGNYCKTETAIVIASTSTPGRSQGWRENREVTCIGLESGIHPTIPSCLKPSGEPFMSRECTLGCLFSWYSRV